MTTPRFFNSVTGEYEYPEDTDGRIAALEKHVEQLEAQVKLIAKHLGTGEIAGWKK